LRMGRASSHGCRPSADGRTRALRAAQVHSGSARVGHPHPLGGGIHNDDFV